MKVQNSKLKTKKLRIKGKVIRGEGYGKKIGYPTANLDREYFDEHPVENGIYICKVKITNYKLQITNYQLEGIAIIGAPYAQAGKEGKIEIHILDFNENIYGQFLEAEIMEKMRDIEKYENTNDLIEQIKKDIKAARKIL